MLEDRVTHAFISTLQLLSNELCRKALSDLTGISFGRKKSNWILDVQNPSPVKEGTIKKEGGDKGYLLKIRSMNPKDLDDEKGKRSDTENGNSRPDGIIYKNGTLILIESKLNKKFNPDQLSDHKTRIEELVDVERREIISINKSWQNIDRIFRSILENHELEESERAAIDQFIEFLYEKGITMNFEKLYDQSKPKEELLETWASNHPLETLEKLSEEITEKLEIPMSQNGHEIKHRRQNKNTWKRLFELDSKMLDGENDHWRGTVYVNIDGIAVDFIAFKPIQKSFPKIRRIIKNVYQELDQNDQENDLRRTKFYAKMYGVRTGEGGYQNTRNYDHSTFSFDLGQHIQKFEPPINLLEDNVSIPDTNDDNIFEYLMKKSINPKQIGLKYNIHCPSNSFWDKPEEGETLNHKDAVLLKNPKENNLVQKLSDFLNLCHEKANHVADS